MKTIPIIDLFAGPGGLGEGFSAFETQDVKFDIKLSIEKDAVAQKTLLLRSFFRNFAKGAVPKRYYDYIRGVISQNELYEAYPNEHAKALTEAWCAELGVTPGNEVHDRIRNAVGKSESWILIGGPPCQAYSMAGRSRMLGKLRETLPEDKASKLRTRFKKNYPIYSNKKIEEMMMRAARTHAEKTFQQDQRHKLYEEYLEIVAVHQPSIFVMENVKGILSSKIKTGNVLDQILDDFRAPWSALDAVRKGKLKKPTNSHGYTIHSFVVERDGPNEPEWSDSVINAEKYGVPQRRHRLILLGVRDDITAIPDVLKKAGKNVTVQDVIGDLPRLRSHISRKPDDPDEWLAAVRDDGRKMLLSIVSEQGVRSAIEDAINDLSTDMGIGGAFISSNTSGPCELRKWFADKKIGGVTHHRARGHMAADLHRYMFAAATARVTGVSPTLFEFPVKLLPKHKNTDGLKSGKGTGRKNREVIFEDRFRVQIADKPATTITSHISKDGHYYIHYDPTQCRSLTGREAARIQTFPDNYFFEGNRTEQYHQIGNAVPPYLAYQLAGVVARLIEKVGHGSKR